MTSYPAPWEKAGRTLTAIRQLGRIRNCLRLNLQNCLFNGITAPRHDLRKAIDVFECLCALAENDPALRARIETSFRRITGLKRRFLATFTGFSGGESLLRLKAMNHQRFVNRIYGNL